MQPSFKDVSYGFGEVPTESHSEEALTSNIFRNSLVFDTKLIQASELPNIKFFFKTGADPETGSSIDLNFARVDFKEITGEAGKALFKLGVFNWLENKGLEEAKRKEASLKHQVLCDITAIVGVCKQENKATGEVQETTIKFGKSEIEDEPEDDQLHFGGMKMKKRSAAPMMMAKSRAAPMMTPTSQIWVSNNSTSYFLIKHQSV